MAILTVTHRGQVTLRKDVLKHLGIKPGDKIALDLLPEGVGMLKASKASGNIEDFFGLLAHKTKKVATLEEIKLATLKAWAGQA